jgi:thiol:disulfide interchange protein DsbD
MFGAVALGMAAPYVLLSARPGWMVILPRPGAWMERLKQFMGFPLLATLVWIFSILGGQKGVGGMVWFAAFLTCLAVACWLYGAFCGPLSKPRERGIALVAVAAFALGGGAYFLGVQFPKATAGPAAVSTDGIAWVPFSAAELARLRAEGKPVFLDFTADWCLSCKFNERTAIDTPAVREVLTRESIVAMKADWTNANPEITAALKEFGRVGVPFYVLYPANNAPAVTLPELLTEAIVLEALKKAR